MAFQLFPSFNFNESNVGPRPVRAASVDRIGLVGMFSRGPLTPMIVDAETARMIYGFTADVGSAHLQAMIDQGANSFVINRVLGAAEAAKLNTTISGTAVGAGTLDFSIKSGATTVVAQVALAGGETASAVVTSLVAAINALGTNTYVTATAGAGNSGTTGQMTVTAKAAGIAGNSLQVRFTLTTTTGLTFGPGSIGTTLTNLAGGTAAPVPATCIVDNSSSASVFTLEAVWPGANGNNITCVVSAGSDTGLFDITLEYPAEAIKEVYRDVDLTDIYDEDKLSVFRGSLLVRGTLNNGTLSPKIGSPSFTGGSDGDTVVTDDFIAAVSALKDVQCTMLICPGQKPVGVDQKAIQAAMTAQAEAIDAEMGELQGLRIAIGSLPRNTKVSEIATYKAANWIPNSKRTVILMGWATYSKISKFRRFGIDPAALYAAKLLVTPHEVSPAARTSSPFVVGITEVDTPVGNAAWNEITKNKMDAIMVDPASGGFTCLNGRTTSSDGAWYWICYRRVYDKIRMDIFFGFQFTKSEPSSRALDGVVEGTANNYLQGLLMDRVIAGFNPAVSNDVNNPAPIRAAGKRFVDIYIELLPPNDHTQFNINRVLTASVRLA